MLFLYRYIFSYLKQEVGIAYWMIYYNVTIFFNN